MNLILICITLQITIIPVFRRVTQVLLQLQRTICSSGKLFLVYIWSLFVDACIGVWYYINMRPINVNLFYK